MEVSCKAADFCPPNVRSVNHIGLFQIARSLNSYLLINVSTVFDHRNILNDTLNMYCIAPPISGVKNI